MAFSLRSRQFGGALKASYKATGIIDENFTHLFYDIRFVIRFRVSTGGESTGILFALFVASVLPGAMLLNF